ncbi:hypothetical protein GCM10010313_22610 [Streptomyces violarus]|uniref:Uncharacterized protein n=1 Tax=Streptomyces violarus TaxID=67380 RepID=A0A7W4ZTS9_9ACTN|nr:MULTISPECIES: hypothetical protein [Streptomyces]MBB3078521.1 hypothetical protein [Streptomyces violarus]WRU03063.1 hypothetical protein VJ737_37620 [Streptomyces sp. CGMCC 4.1772]GHD05604.1 hypothetical protein GCM10010313_22610 [Streptomyces violarus]
MIESQMPDLTAVRLRDVLGTDDTAVRRGAEWVGMQAEKASAVAASGGGEGGGAERIG